LHGASQFIGLKGTVFNSKIQCSVFAHFFIKKLAEDRGREPVGSV